MTVTTRQVLNRAGISIPDELVADLTVPVVVGKPQRQGDVSIVPAEMEKVPYKMSKAELDALEVVPAEGVAVVRGEATGNTHLLQSEPGLPAAKFSRRSAGLILGVCVVPEGGVAHLIHTDEHGVNSFGPGTWVFRGKREKTEVDRRVQD